MAASKPADESKDARPPVLMLVQVVERGADLDAPPREESGPGWHASPQAKLERLLRETEVPAGLLCNGTHLRLVHAPRGESSGHLTFPVQAMAEVAGRPILAALEMLLGQDCVFSAPDGRRLSDLLRESRKYQNEVSTQLAGQVLGALWDLLAGFQAADAAAQGHVLGSLPEEEPGHVYGGLLAVLMRLVFLLYAEDEGLMPDDGVYQRNYSVTGLFDRLREDAGRSPDTMDSRHGAWAALLSLFRLVHDGGGHQGDPRTGDETSFHLPPRHGDLFNPDVYPFLEGRPRHVARVMGETFTPPRVSDGCLHRVLEALLVLDGERLSYRALDVEQVGSVYEAIMGFAVERAAGRSIAVRPKDVVIDVDALLEVAPAGRVKHLQDSTECALSGSAATALKDAETPEDVVAALGRKVSPRTPRLLPAGSLSLQPGEERRRTGSHYTPRELTEPIVRTTLRPVLENLAEKRGGPPTPQDILDLEVCDPAMGSGAFLVEACRQLAETLVEAWQVHDALPDIPPDEDPLLHARRLVAQRCLHGVDKNPFAVSLAKLSLWLVTLAKDHPFTFLDHALKHGDSLVGLTRKQIGAFHWKDDEPEQAQLFGTVSDAADRVGRLRDRIQDLPEDDYDAQREVHREAEAALSEARLLGDLVIAAYFSAGKDRQREECRQELRHAVERWKRGETDDAELRGVADELRGGDRPVPPFHWEIEFPEVFGRENPGFDAIVGNPPFLGGTLIGSRLGLSYHAFLVAAHPPATGLADLAAFFVRRSFHLLAPDGATGLITTNTISQGDTRATGLQAVLAAGGFVYSATRRHSWPGHAAVVASILHLAKRRLPACLDGRSVARISAYLLEGESDDTPKPLAANKGTCFAGTKVWGAGFVFERDPSGGSWPLSLMNSLSEQDSRNREVLFKYIGGQEFNDSPTQAPSRFVIDFGDVPEETARLWPSLFALVEERVRPVRASNKQRNYRDEWWRHANRVEKARPYMERHGRSLVLSVVSAYFSVGFVMAGTVVANSMIIILRHTMRDFACIQSRLHEGWARLLGSSMKDDARYTTPCFDTFPLPPSDVFADLETSGEAYHDFRAGLMVSRKEGLTRTYGRFHDPNERSPDIVRLRDLHAEMDRAVLNAYGWTDIPTRCGFFLDYAIDEETWGNKKKPWRYRWPDEVHDEVLARLLELNRQRAEEESRSGLPTSQTEPGEPATPNPRRSQSLRQRKPHGGPAEEPSLPGLGDTMDTQGDA
jgi:hypothetical protein